MDLNILSVDFVALRDAVVKNPNIKYIVMNELTLERLQLHPIMKNKDSSQFYATFYGVPIAVCNRLQLGAVELI